MKHSFLIFMGCFCFFQVNAQSDTTYIIGRSTTESATEPSMAYTEARTEVLHLNEPIKRLLKCNVLSLIPFSTGQIPFSTQNTVVSISWSMHLQLSAEQKLGNSFSLGMHISSALLSEDLNERGIYMESGLHYLSKISIQPEVRWYYRMKKQVKKGIQASNLAGPYLGLNYRWAHYRKDVVQNSVNNVYGGLLMLGIQHRLFKYGYFDLGYGVGVTRPEKDPANDNPALFSSALRVQLGFALSGSKQQSAKAGNYCEFLRCFREERRMFKLDLLNLVDFYGYQGYQRVFLRPNLAFEQKIGQSAYSIESQLNLELGYSHTKSIYTTIPYTGTFVDLEWVIQPRHYFQMKRNIAKGKAGNNLNGLYWGLHTGLKTGRSKYGSNIVAGNLIVTKGYDLALVFGCQYRFLKRGFVDLYVGAGKGYTHEALKDNKALISESSRQGLLLLGKFRVGVAF